jgi:hypothetical protein
MVIEQPANRELSCECRATSTLQQQSFDVQYTRKYNNVCKSTVEMF